MNLTINLKSDNFGGGKLFEFWHSHEFAAYNLQFSDVLVFTTWGGGEGGTPIFPIGSCKDKLSSHCEKNSLCTKALHESGKGSRGLHK